LVFGAFDLKKARDLLPARPSDMNKTDRGRILVAGGSKNYPGAAILVCLSALRGGGGIVSLLSLPEVCHACASRFPEAVQLPAEEGAWLNAALAERPRTTAAVVGPGLGRSDAALVFVADLWTKWDRPLLADGDALYALAVSREKLPPRDNAVLTPHEGEAARLLSWTPEEVRRNRTEAAERLAKQWGCVLLKGKGTLVAAGIEGKISQTARLDDGGPELSVPGSGDVLSGCVGTLLAQGLDPFDAACLGGALHGLAGRRLRESKGIDGILASEIADELPFVIHALRSGKLPSPV
jgi:NAD(P)H-hydrate epimerase